MSFWLFLVNQKLRRKNPADHRHNYIKVSHLRSPINIMKGIFSKKKLQIVQKLFLNKKLVFI